MEAQRERHLAPRRLQLRGKRDHRPEPQQPVAKRDPKMCQGSAGLVVGAVAQIVCIVATSGAKFSSVISGTEQEVVDQRRELSAVPELVVIAAVVCHAAVPGGVPGRTGGNAGETAVRLSSPSPRSRRHRPRARRAHAVLRSWRSRPHAQSTKASVLALVPVIKLAWTPSHANVRQLAVELVMMPADLGDRRAAADHRHDPLVVVGEGLARLALQLGEYVLPPPRRRSAASPSPTASERAVRAVGNVGDVADDIDAYRARPASGPGATSTRSASSLRQTLAGCERRCLETPAPRPRTASLIGRAVRGTPRGRCPPP